MRAKPQRDKKLCGAESESLSRFSAGSPGAPGPERRFNQTVTSPPGAERRAETQSLRGAPTAPFFCSRSAAAATTTTSPSSLLLPLLLL